MNLRKLNISARRERINQQHGPIDQLSDGPALSDYLKLTDALIENGIGIMGLPLGLATGFVIDGRDYTLPLVTEEPSVIAAASFAATVVAHGGGFVTSATAPLMDFQVVFEDPTGQAQDQVTDRLEPVRALLDTLLATMTQRGGGLRELTVTSLPEIPAVKFQATVDVCDALGANILNTCAEQVGALLADRVGRPPLMCIVSNAARHRQATATCSLSHAQIAQLCRGKHDPPECTRRLIQAGRLAQVDPERAVTHNKGIMNGITALALATGNDTRAQEAAAHAWAARDGQYRGLSQYEASAHGVTATLTLPLPLATVGGAIQHHPTSRFALRLLGNPNGPTLMRIAAALGLAQNLAALCALVGTGIQHGHMPLHAKKGAAP